MLHKGFSQAWYGEAPYLQMWYMGWPIVKCPLDLWQYHEILWQTKPDLVVETGTFQGGSALWFAHQFDLLEQHEDHAGGKVISVDLKAGISLPKHDRIKYVEGLSSTDLRVVEALEKEAEGKKVMVVLDSDHSKKHVLQELKLYSKLVSPGCFLIVEDTNVDGYGAMVAQQSYDKADGLPSDAIQAWKPEKNGFVPDKRRERFLFTQNPGGYLLKEKS